MTFHLLGSAEVDETFRARLETADKISPAQMGAVNAAMERAVGETALELESQMILLATAVSGSPFLGLLGTVWGVMDTFTDVAVAGSPNIATMAPGVSGALITTVMSLCVAIPAMFGYNFLVTSIRGIIVEMDNFAAELASEFEHKYVDHERGREEFRREMRRSRSAAASRRSPRSTSRRCSISRSCCSSFSSSPRRCSRTASTWRFRRAARPMRAVDPSKVQTVSIDRNSAIKFNNEPVDAETLTCAWWRCDAANPDVAVVIRPDRELPVQKLVSLMDVLQRAQITKVGIATKAETR